MPELEQPTEQDLEREDAVTEALLMGGPETDISEFFCKISNYNMNHIYVFCK